MTRLKTFFIAAALTLVTAGVFAGKTKFAISGVFAYVTGTGYVQLDNAASLVNLSESGSGSQAAIKGSNSGQLYGLYDDNSGSYNALYFAE